MASSSIELTSTWLGKLLLQEVEYLSAVSGKVEELQSEFEWMQCFLYDVDEKQNKNALLRKWVSDIKDLAFKAEDLIETYILHIAHKPQNNAFFSWDGLKWLACCWKNVKPLHNIGSDIDVLNAKISKMTSRLQAYGIQGSYHMYNNSSLVANRKFLAEERQTYPHVGDKETVGLDESVSKLMDTLTRDGQHTVVVVYGMGGIGKTTLAQEVLKHRKIKDHFDGCAWAYVSQQPQHKAICKDIANQLITNYEGENKLNEILEHIKKQLITNPEDKKLVKELEDIKRQLNTNHGKKLVEELDDTELHGKLCDMLKKKNYLVILDDIWYSRDWNCLKSAFPVTYSSHGSKLLITTRNPQIFSSLEQADVVSYYQVEVLNQEMSWQLFEKKIDINKEFKDDPDQEMDQRKVELGKKMLHHCNGHPLAIDVLGGILATKKSMDEWVSVANNLSYHLQGNESYSSVYEVLAMSYYDLPYHMKPCFLHLGNFPEDFDIPVEKLYHIWIAEGIVSSTQDSVKVNRSLEDISECYMKELVQKNMVQVGSTDSYGKIRTCCLHDLMRDKCIEINEEEDFLQVFDNRACKSEDPMAFQNAPSESLRRMTVYVDQQVSFPLPNTLSGKVPRLRSLLFFPSKDGIKQDCKGIVTSICEDFKLLRVLDFEGLHLFGCLPRKVGDLIYLRSLSLKGTHITKLPKSIENLRSLMILDLRVSHVILKLPNLLWKMRNLIHLYFPSRIFPEDSRGVKQGYEIEDSNKMLKLDQLSHLEKLENVDLDKVDVMGLLGLRSMRKLTASNLSQKEFLAPLLKSKSIKDFSLKISADIIKDDHEFLSGCGFLKVLQIDDKGCNKTVLPMNVVKALPKNLVELGFWYYCILPEDPMPILENFPKLRKLELHLCYNGKSLVCSEKGFPELTYLFIDGLFFLESWFVGKGGLPKLKKVEIYNTRLKMLPDLQSHVDIACKPCVNGIKKYGTCPYIKDN